MKKFFLTSLFWWAVFLLPYLNMLYGQGSSSDGTIGSIYTIDVVPPAEDGCNGALLTNVDQANNPHTYIWSDGSTESNLLDLCSGNYSVTIVDSNGCTWELNAFVANQNACNISIETWQVSHRNICLDGCNDLDGVSGQIILTPISPGVDMSDYSFEWSDGSQSNELSTYYDGEYEVTITNTSYSDCQQVLRFLLDKESCDGLTTYSCQGVLTELSEMNNCEVVEALDCIPDEGGNEGGEGGEEGDGKKDLSYPPVIINEFSNGSTVQDEFVELLVVGDKQSCLPLDIRGMILDDNNGCFSIEDNNMSSFDAGVSAGCLIFPYSDQWASVPVGSIIVIYNEKFKNVNLPDDDFSDSDSDGVYVISASELNSIGYSPSIINSEYIYAEEDLVGGEWANIWLYDKGDAIQLRYADGSFCHGVSYGNMDKITGGEYDMKINSENGAQKVYAFNDGSPLNHENFFANTVSPKTETPGLPNNKANLDFINQICTGLGTNTGIEIAQDVKVEVYPNPFSNEIFLDIISLDDVIDVDVELINLVGEVVYKTTEQLYWGNNKIHLSGFKKSFNNGIYFVEHVFQS